MGEKYSSLFFLVYFLIPWLLDNVTEGRENTMDLKFFGKETARSITYALYETKWCNVTAHLDMYRLEKIIQHPYITILSNATPDVRF